ncbi:MAG TPA: hypothetical protein VK005_03015 [Acholeplasma sp.]|nr:hypothetical protein [Acholeplasma sp.]
MLLAILLLLPIPIWAIMSVLDSRGKRPIADQTVINELASLVELEGCNLVVKQQDVYNRVRTI